MIDDPFKKQDATKMSNADLRKHVRILEARLETLGTHLQQMGPFMQAMMKVHFDVLTLAHKQQKKLTLAVLGVGPGQLAAIKKTLAGICAASADFAAEYRKLADPTLNTNHLVALQIKAAEARAELLEDDND